MNHYEQATQEVRDAFNALCKGRVEAAVKAEREACAKVCEGRIGGAVQTNEWWIGFKSAMNQCAVAIRARGQA